MQAMGTKYVFSATTFREERLLRRSRKRLEAVQIDQAFERASEQHDSFKQKMGLKNREKYCSSIEKLTTDEVQSTRSCDLSRDLSLSKTAVIAEDEKEACDTCLSDSLTDTGETAEDPEIMMEIEAVKYKNIDAKQSAASSIPTVVRSSSIMTTHSNKKESFLLENVRVAREKARVAREKDTVKLSPLIPTLYDHIVCCDMISDTIYEKLKQWKASIEIWDENQMQAIKLKTFIPLKVGSRTVDTHSMREKNWNYLGEENRHGLPHGQGKVVFENGDWMFGEFRDGLRHGQGTLKTKEELSRYEDGRMESCKVSFIDGTFVADLLEGPGKIEWSNGDVLACTFTQGVVHGFTRLFDCQKKLKHVCWYQNGFPYGFSWQFCEGGGFLVGVLDQFGHFSGSQLAFLYPDMKTALYGVFSSGRMVSAGTAVVQLATKRDNIFNLVFKRMSGSGYKYDLATDMMISSRTLVRDPYESEFVEVDLSKDRSKGEGLFITKPVGANTILAFYNGIKLSGAECVKADNWQEDAYKIMDLLPPDETGESGVLDIPVEYQNIEHYCASLAHKANHSFKPNAQFCLCYHPRFGPVPALRSMHPMQGGNEVLVNYEYAYDEAPPWYTALHDKQLAEEYKMAKKRDWETLGGYQREV